MDSNKFSMKALPFIISKERTSSLYPCTQLKCEAGLHFHLAIIGSLDVLCNGHLTVRCCCSYNVVSQNLEIPTKN